jgi:hypothetical protein
MKIRVYTSKQNYTGQPSTMIFLLHLFLVIFVLVVCQEQRFCSILTGTFLWNPILETDKSIVIAEIGCRKKYCLGFQDRLSGIVLSFDIVNLWKKKLVRDLPSRPCLASGHVWAAVPIACGMNHEPAKAFYKGGDVILTVLSGKILFIAY